jgi:hypothetical protein
MASIPFDLPSKLTSIPEKPLDCDVALLRVMVERPEV